MAKDCKVIDRYNYQGPLHLNEPSNYAYLFNGYFLLCANYGHIDRDCEVFDGYNHCHQNPRSKFAGSQDWFHDDFVRREYVLGTWLAIARIRRYGK